MKAIAQCSPQFKIDFFQNKKKYRDIDGIPKPSKVIEEIVPDWEKNFVSKPKFAEKIAPFMSLEKRNSMQANRSFHICLETLSSINKYLL